jgi:hypothetical protein
MDKYLTRNKNKEDIVPGVIRIGTIGLARIHGRRPNSEYPGFTRILLKDLYKELELEKLRDEDGRFFLNYWYASKVSIDVRGLPDFDQVDQYGVHKYRDLLADIRHGVLCDFDENTSEYWKWRQYVIDRNYVIYKWSSRSNLLHKQGYIYSVVEGKKDRLNFIDALKQVYIKKYIEIVQKKFIFHTLKERVKAGENILIVCNNPFGILKDYLNNELSKDVPDNFFDKDTFLVTKDNISILLNYDTRRLPAAVCLGIALMDIDPDTL